MKSTVNNLDKNILKKLNEGNPHWKMHGDREQMQQHVQDNGRGPGLVGYAMWMWKSDTKSVT